MYPADGVGMEPPEEVRPEALVPLTSFKSTNWHLGERVVLLPPGATNATIAAALLQDLMAGSFGTACRSLSLAPCIATQ